jgi:cysteinyl-tRNA synthetase
MQIGARVGVDERKENPLDFAVWKGAKPGEPSWDSPWGPGRPGWHIECSAMSLHHLGEQIDIHGGGNDLVFPHHENEIAQSESLTGKQFARYWMHNGMLQFDGEKMSKSLGNLITIDAFLEDHEADVLRMAVLNGNYRQPLTFNDDVLEQSKKAIERLRSALRPAFPESEGADKDVLTQLSTQVETTHQGFIEAMDDDFNSAGALGQVFDLVRVVNHARDSGATDEQMQPAQKTITDLTSILGLQLEKAEAAGAEAAPFIDLLVEVRLELRKEKLWALSDKIRDQLAELGVVLEDSKEGTLWRWE